MPKPVDLDQPGANSASRIRNPQLGRKAITPLDPKTERFESFPLPCSYANVRQVAGRKGRRWGANPRPAVQSKKPAPNDVNHWSSLHVRPSRSINAMAAEGPQLPAG